MSYIINRQHKYEIVVVANVIPKTLSIEPTNLELGDCFMNEPFENISKYVSVTNKLQSPIDFHWEHEDGSSFTAEPAFGNTRKSQKVPGIVS